MDGKEVYKKPELPNDMTPFDESLAQHYKHAATAKLDWSYNPLIGLFFTLPNEAENDTCAINPTHMYRSLYVCEKPESHPNAPILFTDDYARFNGNNQRIIRQEGLFAVLAYPITFYW